MGGRRMVGSNMSTVRITLELEPEQAAALHRLCDKLGHEQAMAFLYDHVSKPIRVRQAYSMLEAVGLVQRELEDVHVGHWPWIESGEVAA